MEIINFSIKRADFNRSNILSFYTTLSSPYMPKSHPLSCPSYPICSPDYSPPLSLPLYFVTTSLLLRIRPLKETYESFYIKEHVRRRKYCSGIENQEEPHHDLTRRVPDAIATPLTSFPSASRSRVAVVRIFPFDIGDQSTYG